jgi:hypothetical protein
LGPPGNTRHHHFFPSGAPACHDAHNFTLPHHTTKLYCKETSLVNARLAAVHPPASLVSEKTGFQALTAIFPFDSREGDQVREEAMESLSSMASAMQVVFHYPLSLPPHSVAPQGCHPIMAPALPYFF